MNNLATLILLLLVWGFITILDLSAYSKLKKRVDKLEKINKKDVKENV